ncbi:MAG TPA: murein biosynthesis integral membrane protein MurJ [Micropepsaceae bacterium]|jgi:putative peptidoglycan lipid II flippase|nr:murein biosynthesis integral membrane protein MurJ [Micropepsaceae bacterium]
MIGRLLSVGGFTLLSRITGFGRDIVMAAVLGSGPLSDAFLVALRLPNSFRSIFGEGAFNAAFIQRFAKVKTQEGPRAAADFANRVFSWQMVAQLVLLAAALAGMEWVVRVLAPGFVARPEQLDLAVRLSRIAFPYLLMTVVAIQLSAMLNANGKFATAAAWSLFLNIAMMGTLGLAGWFPNAGYAAAWGVFIAGIMQLVFIVWAAAKNGLYLRFTPLRWTADMREFLRALGAATFGSASVQILLFVDTLIASFLPSGALTALYYSDRINQLPMGTLGIALGTVLLPEMATRIAQDDHGAANAAQNRAAALGLLFTLPFVAAYFTVPLTIMRGLFAHGAFHLEAAELSAAALMAYGAGLPAFVLIRVVAPSFYARGDTATPVRATMISVLVNIVLKFAFVWGLGFGAVGLALGTSLAIWVNVGVLIAMARNRGLIAIDGTFLRAMGPSILAALATGAGALAGVAATEKFASNDLAQLAGAIVIGGLAYGAVVFLFRRSLPLGRRLRA